MILGGGSPRVPCKLYPSQHNMQASLVLTVQTKTLYSIQITLSGEVQDKGFCHKQASGTETTIFQNNVHGNFDVQSEVETRPPTMK